MRIRIISKRNRDRREIRDRNTEWHQEGNPVNTDFVFLPHAYIFHSERAAGANFINTADLISPTLGQDGADSIN